MWLQTLNRLIALAVTVVILGAGLCVFDGDHGAQGDLCLLFLATTTSLAVWTLTASRDWGLAALTLAYAFSPSDLPTPPPEP